MGTQHLEQSVKHTLDAAIGVGAITWPMWVQIFETAGYVITFLGGIVLLGLRIAIAVHELREKRKKAQ